MSSVIAFKIFDSAAIILKLLGVKNDNSECAIGLVIGVKFSTDGQNKVIIGVEISYRL